MFMRPVTSFILSHHLKTFPSIFCYYFRISAFVKEPAVLIFIIVCTIEDYRLGVTN